MVMARTNASLPYWRYVKLPKDYRFERSLAVIHRHVQALIERARWRMRHERSDSPRNLLEAMLALRDESGSGLTDEVVSANVLTILLGGEDTTANTLAWLDLFEATATEATRMKPIVPLFFLEPVVDVQLGGAALPAGTPLFFLMRPAMLDEGRFGQAAQFRPERWLGDHAHAEQPHDTRG